MTTADRILALHAIHDELDAALASHRVTRGSRWYAPAADDFAEVLLAVQTWAVGHGIHCERTVYRPGLETVKAGYDPSLPIVSVHVPRELCQAQDDRCPSCLSPTHASESDDLGRCARCMSPSVAAAP